MIIADLNYLDQASETTSVNLRGGRRSAVAISSFWAVAFGSSTYTGTTVINQAGVRPNGSFASSSVQVTALSSDGSVAASASSSSFASS